MCQMKSVTSSLKNLWLCQKTKPASIVAARILNGAQPILVYFCVISVLEVIVVWEFISVLLDL